MANHYEKNRSDGIIYGRKIITQYKDHWRGYSNNVKEYQYPHARLKVWLNYIT